MVGLHSRQALPGGNARWRDEPVCGWGQRMGGDSPRCGHSVHDPAANWPLQLPVRLRVGVVDEGCVVIAAVRLSVEHRHELHVRDRALRDRDWIAVAAEDTTDRRTWTRDSKPRGLPVGGELFRGAAVLRSERTRACRAAGRRSNTVAARRGLMAETRATAGKENCGGGERDDRNETSHYRR